MIKKSLDSLVKRERSSLDEASSITEVKLLLQEDENKDISFIQNAFPGSTNTKIIINNVEDQQVNKLSEMHNGDIYTKEQIKSICMKYRLRFLSSTKYTGNIPIDVIHDIKNKMESVKELKYLSQGSSSIYERNLFMLAPAGMFNVKSVKQTKREELEEIKRLRELDPAVFIKVDDDKYLFVREFGNSFSIFRRVLGAFTAKTSTLNMVYFVSWLLYNYLFIKLLLTPLFSWGNSIQRGNGMEVLSFLLIILTMIAYVATSIGAIISGKMAFFMSSIKSYEDGWFSIDGRFATENNWNKN